MKLKGYKKTIEDNEITFTIKFELPEEPTDENEVTISAILAILACTGITPADLTLHPPVMLSTIQQYD